MSKEANMPPALPILYSFRRCPYAMRARLALSYSGIVLEHREIILKDKPQAMLDASPKGTVPVLVLPDGTVIDESLDVMRWALEKKDTDGWLDGYSQGLITQNDTNFKRALDRYKYPNRYPDEDCSSALDQCLSFLKELENYLVLSQRSTLTDMAIFPFIRQFSKVNPEMFKKLPYPTVQSWLEEHVNSDLFQSIMNKHPVWTV
jgi:glutathione S-transferase